MLLTIALSRRMASVVKSVHKEDERVLVSSRRLCLEHKSFATCYGLNVFLPRMFPYSNPNAQCGSIRRWGIWEVINS